MTKSFIASLLAVAAFTSTALAQPRSVPQGYPVYNAALPPPGAAPAPYTKSTPNEESTSGEYRVLGGHRFITPTFIESAILNTSVAFAQGGGVLQYRGVSVLNNGAPTDAQIFIYTQTVLGTIGIGNRLAFDLRASGAAAVGGDLDTILTVGALANLNAGGMGKIRLLTLEDVGFQLTAGAGGYYSRTLNLQPSILLGKALGDAKALEADVIAQTSSFEFVPAVMAAEGVGPFGAQLSISPKIRTATGSYNSLDVGGQLTLDIGKITSYVPIALSGEYQLSSPLGSTTATPDHHIGASLFYSGRQAFSVGLLGGVNLYPNDMKIITGGMAMQYFF